MEEMTWKDCFCFAGKKVRAGNQRWCLFLVTWGRAWSHSATRIFSWCRERKRISENRVSWKFHEMEFFFVSVIVCLEIFTPFCYWGRTWFHNVSGWSHVNLLENVSPWRRHESLISCIVRCTKTATSWRVGEEETVAIIWAAWSIWASHGVEGMKGPVPVDKSFSVANSIIEFFVQSAVSNRISSLSA